MANGLLLALIIPLGLLAHELGHAHWRWADVDRFDHVGSRVYVVLRTGHAIALVGIAQGYRITWRDGETRDVVGVLNERLDLWRKQHEEAVAHRYLARLIASAV